MNYLIITEYTLLRIFALIRGMINKLDRKSYTEDDKIIQAYTRSLPMDLSALADSISKLNGVVSRRTLMTQLDFVSDAALEEEQLRKEQEELIELEVDKAKKMFNATPQPTMNNAGNKKDTAGDNILQNKGGNKLE